MQIERKKFYYKTTLEIQPRNISINYLPEENFFCHHGRTKADFDDLVIKCKKLDSPVNLKNSQYLRDVDTELYEIFANNIEPRKVIVQQNGKANVESWRHRILALKCANLSVISNVYAEVDAEEINSCFIFESSERVNIIIEDLQATRDIFYSAGIKPTAARSYEYWLKYLLVTKRKMLLCDQSLLLERLFKENKKIWVSYDNLVGLDLL